MNYKIITGCDDRYILTMIDFYHYHLNIGINISNIVMYNFGLSEFNLNKLYSTYPDIVIKTLDYSLYPDFVNPHYFNGLNCSYAFKVVALYLECQLLNSQPNTTIIWMDSANRAPISSLINIIKTVNIQGFYSPISAHPGSIEALELNHSTCLQTIFVQESDYKNLFMISANLIGVNYHSINGKNIMNSWYHYSLIKNAICPDNSSRNNHRQDQSVLSAVLYLYGKENNIQFEKNNFGVRFWVKKDATTISSTHKPYKLLLRQNNQQLAIIHCENDNDAIETYANRKHMLRDDFLKLFDVKITQV